MYTKRLPRTPCRAYDDDDDDDEDDNDEYNDNDDDNDNDYDDDNDDDNDGDPIGTQKGRGYCPGGSCSLATASASPAWRPGLSSPSCTPCSGAATRP